MITTTNARQGSRVGAMVAFLLLGCGPGVAADATEDASTTPATTNASTGPSTATSVAGTSSTSTGDPGTTGDPITSSSGPADGTSTGEACDPLAPVECNGYIWDCGNGLDDDGDGLVDMQDPDCVSPCDDREDEFAQGLPGDNWDCNLDCGFDGNKGHGDDMCEHASYCDPAAEGVLGCPYDPAARCDGLPATPPGCQGFCERYVPNGCDCFGCCTIVTDAGSIDRWVTNQWLHRSYPDCSFAQPEACPPCTPQIELCGNPCEECELCFGQSEPDGVCESLACVGGTPCEDRCDCGPDEYCMTGCCLPIPND